MALLRRIAAAGSAAGAAARLAATGAGLAVAPAVLTVGLLAEPTRAATRVARTAVGATAAVAGGSVRLAKAAAETGTRAVGTFVTGADPIPDGHVRSISDVARGMVEPPQARHTRRVWAGHDRGHGHVQVEVAAPDVEDRPELRRALRRHLERLEGVEWAGVNDVVGRVLVGIDDRRVSVEEVVGVVTAIEQARGGRQVFPQRLDHPADLEPLLAAVVDAAIGTVAVGVAFVGKVLPVPPLTRHVTLAIALLDSQQWIKDGLEARIGPVGTDLVFTGSSALLHSLTQSPTIPAINAAAAIQQAVEIRARRQVWRRREPELCRPEPEDVAEPLPAPGERPAPMPAGPIGIYRRRLGPTALGGAVGLIPLTRRPGRSADLLKALTPKAAVLGRESFAAVLDLLMCRRDVLPMDGSAYRRLDRVDTVVVDSGALCTGTVFGGRAPLGTRQLLLVNLLTDMFPALAVAVATPRGAAVEGDEGPFAGHSLASVLLAGPQRGFTDTVRRMVLVRGAATTVGATGAWATGRLTGTFARAGTMGLAALIATQLGQTAWAGRRSPLVLATAAGSLAVLFAVVQTPGVSRFFGCRPLGPVSWLVVLGWAAVGTATAELAPGLIERFRAA